MVDVRRLTSDAKASLSPKRLRHVQGVVATAEALARKYGESETSAMIAGWLHDLVREWSDAQLLEAAVGIDIPEGFDEVPALLHGPVAAHLGMTKYGIENESILDAVRFHTTGRPNMTLLDSILFVADAIEPSRTYRGVDVVREAAKSDLMAAVTASIDQTIQHLVSRHRPLFPLTVLTRNDILKRYA